MASRTVEEGELDSFPVPMHHKVFEFVTVAAVAPIPVWSVAIGRDGIVRAAPAPHAVAHNGRIAGVTC